MTGIALELNDLEFESDVAVYDWIDDNVVLKPNCSEEILVTVINHEIIHAILHKLLGLDFCLDFDNICSTASGLDDCGVPT
jgi:hypothetical protein